MAGATIWVPTCSQYVICLRFTLSGSHSKPVLPQQSQEAQKYASHGGYLDRDKPGRKIVFCVHQINNPGKETDSGREVDELSDWRIPDPQDSQHSQP